jgi:hypothetical protein
MGRGGGGMDCATKLVRIQIDLWREGNLEGNAWWERGLRNGTEWNFGEVIGGEEEGDWA